MYLKPGLGIADGLFLTDIMIHPVVVVVDSDTVLVIVASHDWKSPTGIGSVSPRIDNLLANMGVGNSVQGLGFGRQRWWR